MQGSTTVEGMVMSGRKNGGEGNSTNERRGQSNARSGLSVFDFDDGVLERLARHSLY